MVTDRDTCHIDVRSGGPHELIGFYNYRCRKAGLTYNFLIVRLRISA